LEFSSLWDYDYDCEDLEYVHTDGAFSSSLATHEEKIFNEKNTFG